MAKKKNDIKRLEQIDQIFAADKVLIPIAKRESNFIKEQTILSDLVTGNKIGRIRKNAEKRIMSTLKSMRFKKQYYALQNMDVPKSNREKLMGFFKRLINEFSKLFRRKSHVEKILDRIDLKDEKSLIEKRLALEKYGIPAMVRETDKTDEETVLISELIQNSNKLEQAKKILEVSESNAYKAELADYLKDEKDFKKIEESLKKSDLPVQRVKYVGTYDPDISEFDREILELKQIKVV